MTDQVKLSWQVMWQTNDNIMRGYVTTLWQVMWHHDRPGDNIMTSHVTTLWQAMWQHCARLCDNIIAGHVMLQYNGRYVTTNVTHHDRPKNIMTGHVTVLWQKCDNIMHDTLWHVRSPWYQNALFCSARYRLDMFFFYFSMHFHAISLNSLKLNCP